MILHWAVLSRDICDWLLSTCSDAARSKARSNTPNACPSCAPRKFTQFGVSTLAAPEPDIRSNFNRSQGSTAANRMCLLSMPHLSSVDSAGSQTHIMARSSGMSRPMWIPGEKVPVALLTRSRPRAELDSGTSTSRRRSLHFTCLYLSLVEFRRRRRWHTVASVSRSLLSVYR